MTVFPRITYRVLAILSVLLVSCNPFAHNTLNEKVLRPQIKFVGQAVLPTGYMFNETEVGGLSAITYDSTENIYYALSDDKSGRQPARFYKLKIEFKAGELTNESIRLTDVIFLRNEHNDFYEKDTIDPEGIVLSKDGYLFVSSEEQQNPFIAKFTKEGKFLSALPIPDKFLPDENRTKGIRYNFGFESLTISPDGRKLTTAIENALLQDGPQATEKDYTFCRLVLYDLERELVIEEKVYIADKISVNVNEPTDRNLNGLVELLTIQNNDIYYALERSYSEDPGHVIKLYKVDARNGTDVSSIHSLSYGKSSQKIVPVRKHLIFNFNEIGISIDNIEGMTFGPKLPDGTQSLIFISDNNFYPKQFTQILAFSIAIPK